MQSAISDGNSQSKSPLKIDDQKSTSAVMLTTSSSSAASSPTSMATRGLAPIRQSTVAIVGALSTGRGLSTADTLVRCGVRKLLLFSWDEASRQLSAYESRWEVEESAAFEFESYVAEYTFDEESSEHLTDRFVKGADDGGPVDLVILITSPERPDVDLIIQKIGRENGITILKANPESLWMIITDPAGVESMVSNPSMTIGSMALELLLSTA